MSHSKILLSTVGAGVVGLALGTWACADRTAEQPDDVRRSACAKSAAKLMECGVTSGGGSESERVDACVELESYWTDACKEKTIARFECASQLSCDDYRVYASPQVVEPGAPCYEEAMAHSDCLNAK